jgi:hypothetical protein
MKLDIRSGPFPIAAGLVGLALFLLRDVLLLDRAFYERDLLWVYLPVAEAFVRTVAEGALPLRDTSTGFGQPLLANPNMQILYPPTWLHLIMSPDRAFSWLILLHILIGGAGAATLAWRWSKSRVSSFVAGAIWMTSGPVLSLVSIRHHFDGTAWTPWVLLAFDRLLEAPTMRRMFALGAVFGIQALAGSADLCIMSALLVTLRLLCEGRDLMAARPLHALGLSIGSLIVSVSIAAGVWMPGVEILKSSARSALSREERTQWSIKPVLAAEYLLPAQTRTLPLSAEARASLTDGRPPFLKSIFLGPLVLPLMIAALANASIPRRLRVFLTLAILLCALGSLGRYTPVYDVLVAIAPPLGLCRYPAKGAIPLSLLVAVLAGLGAASLQGERARRAALIAGAVMSLANVIATLGIEGLLAGLLDTANVPLIEDSISRVQSGLLLTAALLAFVTAAVASRRQGVLRVALGVGLGLTLWLNRGMNPTVSQEVIQFKPAHAASLREGGLGRLLAFDYLNYPARSAQIFNRNTLIVPDRVQGLDPAAAFIFVVRSALMPPTGGAWGLEYAWDYDLYGLHDLYLRGLSRHLREIEGQPGFLRLLQIANVTRVAALHTSTFGALSLERALPMPLPEPLSIFRVPGALPRAYAVSGARLLTTAEAQTAILDPHFEPSREVILDTGRARPISTSFTSALAVTTRRSDRIALDAALNEDGQVVLVEGFLPGWHATVDGLDVPVRRANALFLSVEVPAGRHQVVFTYRPLSAVIGMGLTFLSLLALFLYFGRLHGTREA